MAGVFVSEGLEESIVNNAEDGCGSSDSQRKSENGNEGKPAILPQAAQRKAEVAHNDVPLILPVGFPALLLEAFHTAKFQHGTPARFRRRNSLGNVTLGALLDMKLKLGLKALFQQRPLRESAKPAHESPLLRSSQNQRDGVSKLLPMQDLRLELRAALARQLVELRFPARGRIPPFRFQPIALLKAVKRWIQRTLRDLKEIFGNLLNALRNGVAVDGTCSHHFEDQHVERSFQELRLLLSHLYAWPP